MSNYAFRDSDRQIKVYANDCSAKDLEYNYVCPTLDCNAVLRLRSLTGEKKPHFGALKSQPHSPHCSIHNVQPHHSDLDSSDFSMDALLQSMSRTESPSTGTTNNSTRHDKNINTESNKITTTRKLYYFCKSFDIEHILHDNIKIKNLIADDRTNFIFTKGIHGLRLVECLYSYYKTDEQNLFFKYPINPSARNQISLSIHIENKDTFSKLKNKLYTLKSRDPNTYIFILADWKNSKSTISSSKQVGIIRE